MRKHVIYVLASLFFFSCSDSIQENIKTDTANDANRLNINFSLANSSVSIAAVVAELTSEEHDDVQLNMTVDGEMASYELEHIQSGQWTLTVKAYDNVAQQPENLKFIGQQTIEIVGGQITTVGISLNPTGGTMQFVVLWGSKASLAFDIDIANQDGDVSAYKYLLERDGFKSISGSLNESEADEGHINFELHDIQHGIWKLTITAVNDGQSPIATGIADIEMLTGVVTIADVSYPINPFSLAINVSYGTQSGTANKFYVGDEKLRLYLINNKGFADLREPYVLKTDAESVQFLELHQQEFVATKNLNKYLNLDVLTHFTNLIELEASGWVIKSLEFLDHPALKHVSLREVEADHVDFSGAPNTIAIDMFDVSIAWIDIDDLNNLQYLDIDGFSGGEICCIIEGKKGIAPPTNFGHNIGSIYVDGSMFGKFDVDESLFIDKSFDTDSVKLKLPDADAKRILMLHELHILRNDFVLKSEADQLQVIFYGSPEGGNPQEPRKGIIPFGSFSTYRPIESLAALKLLPNIFALYLEGQKFTEIDLSNNPALFAVFIDGCQFFSTIDFTGTQLGAIPGKQSLPFSWGKKGVESPVVIINNFSLSSITFGSQPFLFGLEVRENYNLASMDVQNAPDLNFAYFYDNGLTSINLSGLTSLQYVDLSGNKLTSLNLSGLSALVDAIAAGNQLTSVTLTGTTSLSNLQLENNQIASINLSGLSNLSYVSLGNNSLQPSLDITPISLGLSAVYTSGMNANLDTIYYKAGQDTNYIYHDPHTVLQLAPASKMKGAN